MKTKYTLQELKDKKIAIRCDTQEQADKIIKIFGGKNDYSEFYTYYSCYMNFFISDGNLSNAYSDHTVIPASEFFLEDDAEPVKEPSPTEYAVLKLGLDLSEYIKHSILCETKFKDGESVIGKFIKPMGGYDFVFGGYDFVFMFDEERLDGQNSRRGRLEDIESITPLYSVESEKEPIPKDLIPYEYKCLADAVKKEKKQIAEFEQVLAQIKIDAMKLGSRDLARLIKALKEI